MWYETSNPTKNYTVEDGKLKFFNRTLDTDRKWT